MENDTLLELINKLGNGTFCLVRRRTNLSEWQAQYEIATDNEKPYPNGKTYITFEKTPEKAIKELLKKINNDDFSSSNQCVQ